MNVKLPRLRVPKIVRNILISALVLLVLMVSGGVGYIWYTGQTDGQEVLAATDPVVEAPSARPMVTPTKPGPDVPVGASVQALLSPVAPGANTTISIKTRPEATCVLKVAYNNVPSTDSGLVEKQADEFGVVSWTWTVEPAAAIGTWPVDVRCTYEDKSGVVRGHLQVER